MMKPLPFKCTFYRCPLPLRAWTRSATMLLILIFGSAQLHAAGNKPVAISYDVAAHTVSGVITSSDDKQGMPGVNILLKGTAIGTTTDGDGKYTIELPDGNGILVITFIGYERQEVSVEGRTTINVALIPDIAQLQEVVVVGYGTQKKESLTGSVAIIDTKTITQRPVSNSRLALQGVAPGLTVQDAGGSPGGEDVRVSVRGTGNLNFPNPLYVIDGIPQEFSRVDPNDIASITVLKDASASAIYGSRAANGVIVITTKRGALGKTSISYNGYVGITKPTRIPERVSIGDYLTLVNEAYTNAGQPAKFTDEYIQKSVNPANEEERMLYPDTDHFGLLYDQGVQHSHSVGLTGGEAIGTKELRYNVSFNYLDQGGLLVVNSKLQRYSMRSNLDLKLSERFSMNMDMNVIRTDRDYPARDTDVYFRLIHDNPPTYVPKFPNGQYSKVTDFNALAFLETARATQLRNYYYINVTGTLKLADGLKLKGVLAPLNETLRQTANRDKVDFFDYYGTPIAGNASRWGIISNEDRREERTELYLQSLLEYEKTIGKHYVKGLLGAERIAQNFNWSRAYKEGYYNNELDAIGTGDVTVDFAEGNDEALMLGSAFGRLNYDYDQRYLLEANIRYDGASRFASDYRWGVFPSFSAGWVISQEDFMSSVSFINQLKLRASYGELGNQDIRDPNNTNNSTNQLYYNYISYVTTGNPYSFNGAAVQGAWQSSLGVENLQWETAKMTDFGLDVQVMDGKLGITADYYRKITEDVLFLIPIPGVAGMPTPPQNGVEIENKGLELALSYNTVVARDLNISAKLMFSENRNKILDLKGAGPVLRNSNRTAFIEGEEVDVIYGYKTGGLLTQEDIDNAVPLLFSNSRPGDVKYLDISGPNGTPDGIVSATYDRVPLASNLPHYQTSLNLNLAYKNFDLSVFLQGALKQSSILFGALIEGPNWENYTHKAMLERWTESNPNPNASWPRLERSATKSQEPSDFWVRDTKYVRMKNITLGYNLKPAVLTKIGLSTARIYIGGDNLFTMAAEDLLDPEFPSGGRVTYYPQTKTFFAGLNITL
jgi:TonB-linked SusC/RagA family outer membrane protein